MTTPGSRASNSSALAGPAVSTDSRGRPYILELGDQILVTGANGFIGTRVVEALLARGFRNIRCLVRSARTERLLSIVAGYPSAHVDIVRGNLTSPQDCAIVARDVRVIFHLASGIAAKSRSECLLNTVEATRTLLDAVSQSNLLKRFVNVSSLAVYSNFDLKREDIVDESCPLERDHESRAEPYAYAKLKQDELVVEYAARHKWSHVILRPGAVYGPGKPDITGRVGLRAFGIFVNLGSRNRIPFTHVNNCAEAIVLAGIMEGLDGQVFNVIDDELPTGKEFMVAYNRYVGSLRYLSVPYRAFYLICHLWERCVRRSPRDFAPAFNRRRCAAYWKGNRYSNRKLKELTGWNPLISFADASPEYFDYLRQNRLAVLKVSGSS